MPESERMSPLDGYTTQELVDELERRCSGLCLAMVLKMSEDRPNVDDDCFSIINGPAWKLAWMSSVLNARVYAHLITSNTPQPPTGDEGEFDAPSSG